jgi:tetratricopeptide (TPR) repeat protein
MQAVQVSSNNNRQRAVRRYVLKQLQIGYVILHLAAGMCFFFPKAEAQAHAVPADAAMTRQFHEALSLAERGDGRRALESVRDLLQEHPDFVPALKLEGMLFEDAGDNPDALGAYSQALKLSPKDNELLLKVGVLELLRGMPVDAVTVLQQRLKSLPRDEEGLYYLAQAYHLVGNNDAALKTIRSANVAHPGSVQNWQKYGELLCSAGDNEASLTWLKKAQKSDPTLPRINLDLAVASYNSMDLPATVTYATQETKLRPDAVEAFGLLAAAKIKLAQWTDAELILQHILSMEKEDASTLLDLGQCQLELQQYQDSVNTLQRALQLDPTLLLAHFYLSRDFNGLGQADAAKHEAALHRQMMQQIAFTPPKAELQRETILSGRARQMLSEQREDEAIQLFRNNLSGTLGTPGSPYVSVGAVYLEMGDTVAAERVLNRAIEVDAKARGAHTYLGILALQHADLSQAERNFKAELAIDSNHPLAQAELGEVRYRQGRWSEAADLLVKSKTATPQLLYMLCDSYFHLGKVAEADLTAESTAAYAHDQPEVIDSLRELLLQNGQTDFAKHVAPVPQP